MNLWRKSSWYRDAIAYLALFCVAFLPVILDINMAIADEIIQEANKGQDTGANFLLNYEVPTLNNGPSLDPLGPNEIPMRDMFPGYDPDNPSQIDDLSSLRGNPEDLSTQGVAQQFALGGGADETSEAYQTIDAGSSNPHYATIDMWSDTFLDRSREILSGNDPILEEILTACSEDVTAGPDGDDTVTRLEDIWACSQQRNTTTGTCAVERDYVLSPVATQVVLTIEGGGVCVPSNPDLQDWEALHSPIWGAGIGAAQYCTTTSSAHTEWRMQFFSGTPPFGTLANYFDWFCGDWDVAIPTASECAYTATQLEHACRNYSVVATNSFRVNPAHPTAGPPGADCATRDPQVLANYDGDVPVDYTGCPAERITYCQDLRAEFISNCTPDCGCSPANDLSDWQVTYLLIAAGGSAPANYCRSGIPGGTGDDWYFRNGTSVLPPFFSVTDYSAKFCGEFDTAVPTTTECDYTAGQLEHACRQSSHIGTSSWVVNSSHPTAGPSGTCSSYTGGAPETFDGSVPVDYSGCDANRQNYCQTMRTEFAGNCNGGCSGSSGGLLNGTETITSPGIGPGTPEVLANQTVFGGTFDFVETAFNPGDYGLVAGEYVIGDHTVSGDGITASTIDDGGSYGSNWDYTFTATAVDSTNLEVEATLYEIVSNGFVFNGCSQADVQNVESGSCSGSINCIDYTPPCRIVDGVEICENPSHTFGITETLSPWSDFTSVPPDMCWEIAVQIDDCVGPSNCVGNPACVPECDHLPPELQAACLDDPCWVDAQGNDVCLDTTSEIWVNNLGDPGWVDDCADLIGRDECELRPEMSCVEGMEDPLDPGNIETCQLRQRFFDCGSDVVTPGVPGGDDADVTCGAEIRCFGEECSNTLTESNPDFVRAAVAGTTVTEATKDMQCDVQGDPLSCRVFDGAEAGCKDPRGSYLGIIPDCCADARSAGRAGGSFIDYMRLAYHTYRLARDPIIAGWLGQGQSVGSGIQRVTGAPAQLGRAVGRRVVSGFNSALQWAGFSPVEIADTATSAAQTAIEGSATGFGPIQQFVAQGVYNFLESIGADVLADSLFTTTTEGLVTDWATSGLGQMVGTALTVIGLIYTIYQILTILGSIFFGCEEEELQFGIQNHQRACHYVGTYCSKKISFLGIDKCVIETRTHCCFGSPFARIINEQLRLQGIGPEWGTARQPNCEGIPISELENVDWSLVDLSEWEAIIFEAGLVPDPRDPPENFVPTDRHPGIASGGADEGRTSTSINEETVTIVRDPFDEARRTLETEPLCQPDPELMPWYDDGEDDGDDSC